MKKPWAKEMNIHPALAAFWQMAAALHSSLDLGASACQLVLVRGLAVILAWPKTCKVLVRAMVAPCTPVVR